MPAAWSDAPLALLQAWALYNVGALSLATLGAWLDRCFPHPSLPLPALPPRRLDILIAAHDEEGVIGSLVSSLQAQDYPAELCHVWVVADRCTDATAAIARAHGARVFERTTGPATKGAALGWLWEQIRGPQIEAVIVLDADNLAPPTLFRQFDEALRGGRAVYQAQRIAKNPAESAASALDGLAEALHHRVVAPGLDYFGFSTTLSGSGVVYPREYFEGMIGATRTQVEDGEWQLQLMAWGVPIRPLRQAYVYDEKVRDFERMATQRARWIQGKLGLWRSYTVPLLRGALGGQRRSFEGLSFLLTMMPRSLLLLLLGAGLLLSCLQVAGIWPWGIWTGALILFVAHVGTGLAIEGLDPAEVRSLLHAPRFIQTMVLAGLRSLSWRRVPWVRTPHGTVRLEDDPP